MAKLSPIVSSCLLSLAIGCSSNLIAQRLKAYNAGTTPFVLDRALFFHFAILSVITTPVNYWWQVWLEKNFPGWKTADGNAGGRKGRRGDDTPAVRDVELGLAIPLKEKLDHDMHHGDGDSRLGREKDVVRDYRNTFLKWFLDCITLGALLNTALFLILMGIMEGKTNAQIMGNLKVDMWIIIWNSYKIWPIANFVSTMWVRVEKRIVFLSACGLVWNVYLGLVAAEL